MIFAHHLCFFSNLLSFSLEQGYEILASIVSVNLKYFFSGLAILRTFQVEQRRVIFCSQLIKPLIEGLVALKTAFQSTDQGSSSGCAFHGDDESLDGTSGNGSKAFLSSFSAESWQSEEFFGAMPAQVTGSKDEILGLSPDHITLESTTSVEGDEITHDCSFSTNSSLWTEVRPTGHAESASEIRERAKLEGFMEYDRSKVRLGKKIGEGGQGTIYQAALDLPFVLKARPVAVKKFESLKGVSHGHHRRELWELNCMSVCKPEGVFFDEDSALCTIMELFSGNLRQIIDVEMRSPRDPPFNVHVACHIIMRLAMGSKGLHDLGIYHRGLKAENIPVRRWAEAWGCNLSFYDVLIADFESSHNNVGTGFWRAPEVLLALTARTRLSEINWQAADVYSFGTVCYEVSTGKIPFHDRPFSDYDGVLSGERPELPDHVPERLKDIIRRCWRADPDSRPNFTDIIESLKQASVLVDHLVGPMMEMFESLEPGVNAGTRESNLLQLKEIVSTHMEINVEAKAGQANHVYWASKFVATVEQFVSDFGWESHRLHPSLPFAKYEERRRLVVLLARQLQGFYSTSQVVQQYQLDASRYDRLYYKQKTELSYLIRSVHQEILKGFEQSLCPLEEDDDLPLSEKLTIVEARVKSLLNAEVQQDMILMSLGNLLLHMDSEDTNLEIQKFHLRMRWITRFRPFRNYLLLPLMAIGWGSIKLYLIYQALRFSGCNYILSYFGCEILGFHEIFMGWFGPRLGNTWFGPGLVHLVTLFRIFAFYSLFTNYGWKRFLTWFTLGWFADLVRFSQSYEGLQVLKPRSQ